MLLHATAAMSVLDADVVRLQANGKYAERDIVQVGQPSTSKYSVVAAVDLSIVCSIPGFCVK